MSLYPVNLKVEGRLCVIIGGGRVALRKAESLLACGAEIKVISPALDTGFEVWHGRLEHVARPYRWGDLDGAFLAIAATDDDAVNRAVVEEAHGRHLLLNVVDKPEQCNFYVPATVRRGELLVTVSTGGELPALSSRLRQQLQEEFPEAWAEALTLLGEARRQVIDRVDDETKKAQCLGELAALNLVRLLQSGGAEAAESEIEKCISPYLA
ncbi:MAG: precorrin-2 dehydrogenase/sirohydrochlorin ferrochelatase family protein [Thermoleophilia bacterium]